MRMLRLCACMLLLVLVCAPCDLRAQHLPPRINGWGLSSASAAKIYFELTYTNITDDGQIFCMRCIPMLDPPCMCYSVFYMWDKNFPQDKFTNFKMPDAFKAEFMIGDISYIEKAKVDLMYMGNTDLGISPVRWAELEISDRWQKVTRPVDPGTGTEFTHILLHFMFQTKGHSEFVAYMKMRNLVMVYGDEEVVLDTLMYRVSDVNECRAPVPSSHRLLQNYPNPFNPSTIIPYSLSEAGEVDIRVYDMLGREVALAARSYKSAGMHEAVFDGSRLPSGAYWAVLRVSGRLSGIRKMLLVK